MKFIRLKNSLHKLGLVDVAEQYSGTNTGNIANYYAGFAYLKTGKYKEAIASLEKFSTKESVLKAFTTPKFLLKSAKVAIELGKANDAITSLKEIEEDFKSSTEYSEVEGLLGKASAMK